MTVRGVVLRPTVAVSGAGGGTWMSWGVASLPVGRVVVSSTGVGGSNSGSWRSGHIEVFDRSRPASTIAEGPIESRGDGVRA